MKRYCIKYWSHYGLRWKISDLCASVGYDDINQAYQRRREIEQAQPSNKYIVVEGDNDPPPLTP